MLRLLAITQLILLTGALAGCTVGPQPLPPDDPTCGFLEQLDLQAAGEGMIQVSGRWSGDAWRAELINLDAEGAPLEIAFDERHEFEVLIEGEPSDRLRFSPLLCEAAEPGDYRLSSSGALEAVEFFDPCLGYAPLRQCCWADESMPTCTVSWPVHNLCTEPITVGSVTARRGSEGIELLSEIPLSVAGGAQESLIFEIDEGITAEVSFVTLEGAATITIPVTICREPYP